MTVRELADKSELSHSTITDIENFKEIPSQLVMVSISSALNMDIRDVFNLNAEILDIYYFGRNTDHSQ